MLRSILIPVLVGSAMLAMAQQERHDRVRIHLRDRPEGVKELLGLGICLDHADIQAGEALVAELSQRELELAHGSGFEVTTLIRDMSAHYMQRSAFVPPVVKDFGAPGCPGTTHYAMPGNFSYGSMGGFYLWQEMQDQLDSMLLHFPNLISAKQSIGTSHEGRPIYMVRMSNDPNVDQEDPEVLYDALHHAREPESAMLLIYFMWYLMENYGTDPLCTYLLDERELYFVPCVNPDGYVYNETTFPDGGGMWRKNRRDNGDGTFGVDLNRNYGYQWGFDDFGSSPDPASDTYRGPSAFSEPETQAMRDFMDSREIITKHSHHCSGHFLIHAWGYAAAPCPDCDVLAAYAQRMTADNGFIYGDTYGVLNYHANGSATDWSYSEHGALGYVPETGTVDDGFWPVPDRIVPLSQANMEQNLLLALFAGAYAEIEDAGPHVLPGLAPEALFRVRRFGQEDAACVVSVEPVFNVISAGAPVNISGLGILDSETMSIPLVLDPGIQDGEPFRYALVMECDGLVQRDTIEHVHGMPVVLLDDDCTTTANWTGAWAMDTAEWVSPPKSFADSPGSDYYDDAFISCELIDPLDLSLATSATLDLMAKWRLQSEHDHVRIEASTNGISWTALCGRHARQGFIAQGEGEPVYDGQRHEWAAERIVLDDFIGGPLHLRFSLLSDEWRTYEGFNLDDVSVTITESGISSIEPVLSAPGTIVQFPNPASDVVMLRCTLLTGTEPILLDVYDALGRMVLRQRLDAGGGAIDVRALGEGVYTCVISTGSARSAGRLVVAR